MTVVGRDPYTPAACTPCSGVGCYVVSRGSMDVMTNELSCVPSKKNKEFRLFTIFFIDALIPHCFRVLVLAEMNRSLFLYRYRRLKCLHYGLFKNK